MATIPEITDRLEAATEKAENASQIIYDVANGDATTEVPTASGPTPTLKKWFQDLGSAVEPMLAGIPARLDKAILQYETKSEADTAASSLPNGQTVNAEGIQYEIFDGSLNFKKTLSEKDQPVNPMQFGGAWDGITDDTLPVRLAHVHANASGASVTYSGIKKVALQANAQLPVNKNTDWANSEITILGGVNDPPAWDTFNSVYIVEDPDCPLVSVTGSVAAADLAESSYFPTRGLFNDHGYALLTAGLQVPDRDKTGTVNYTQSFKVNRLGKASYPLSVDLSAYAASVNVQYRKTSKSRLVLSNICLNEGTWNNQRLLWIKRCNVKVDGFSLPYELTVDYLNFCQLIHIDNASDIHIDNVVASGRPVTGSGGSYILTIYGGADIYVNGFNALTGWGAVGTNNVNGLHFSKSVLNRVDAHESGHNVFTDDCDIHEYGIRYGWGGGIWKATNVRSYNCPVIANRSDYGGTFFGSILVDGIVAQHNNSSQYTAVNLMADPIGASTPVRAPRTIKVTNLHRTGKSAGGELIPIAVKVRGASDTVFAPKEVVAENITCDHTTWRLGMRVDLLNMEAHSTSFRTTVISVSNAKSTTNATYSNSTGFTSGILDFDRIRTPTMAVIPRIVVDGSDYVAVRSLSPIQHTIRISNGLLNGIQVDRSAPAQPIVDIDNVQLSYASTGDTPPVGGLRAGSSLTMLKNSYVSSVAYDLSALGAATGNIFSGGSINPTLPSGVTWDLMFTGWKAP